MREFGGGGHPTAAAATIKGEALEIIEERLQELIKMTVKPAKVAADIMTKPVITVQWDVSIKEAEAMMTRYGVNVLPIMRKDIYAGLISREIVEKALFLGFGKSQAAEFASIDAITVKPLTPIREIETLMIEQNQRFMPVVENQRIVGAITRTDLLRTLYEEFLRRRKIEETASRERLNVGRNLSSWLREKFPPDLFTLLKLSGEVAEECGFQAYLVGGSVRDLLRGEENLDLDIVIEGDGIQFARIIGDRLHAKVRTHQKFGTAQIFLNTFKLDVATARTEYYESPGALPKVETSSIKKDLYRRDFTINTLSVKLNPSDFGILIDFFGGQRDLREKTIRVLHNLSFVEDPTRAFRAVRFSERFGFKISKHTENLIKSTIEMNLFDRLSGPRLYEELLLSFQETDPIRTIKRISEFGLLKVICPNLIFSEGLEATLRSMHETLSWFNLLFLEEKPDTGVLYLMALLSSLKDDDLKNTMERLSPSPRVKDLIIHGIASARDLLRKLPERDPAEIYRLFHAQKLEIVLFSMSLSRDRQKQKTISRYLTELRNIKPILTGEDLKKMGIPPGPVYSRLLKELLDEKMRGRVKSREDEEQFIQNRDR
jgi:tRNA nucleotidyltransferase (CCA-adding enzyme)